MGNLGCGGDRFHAEDYSFSDSEIEKLRKSFDEMSAFKYKSQTKKSISKKGLQARLPENPDFALKLYNWLRSFSFKDAITFEVFVSAMQVLVKEASVYHIVQFNDHHFEKFEVLLQISLNNYSLDREPLSVTPITFTQGLSFFKEVFNIFNSGAIGKDQLSYLTPKLAVAEIFKNERTTVLGRDFVLIVKQQFPFLDRVVRNYFVNKFIDSANSNKLPSFTQQPEVLSEELLPLFYLSNTNIYNSQRLDLVYSSPRDGKEFSKLASAIGDYHGPLLILIKHTEKAETNHGKDSVSYVCGAFTRSPLRADVGYHGDSDSFLFTLIPRFKKFSALVGADGGCNYVCLNTNKNASPVGLGFGGRSFRDCRLWIDENMEDNSYVHNEDETYEKGSILEPYIKKLNIDKIEVWGLGSESILRNKLDYAATNGNENATVSVTTTTTVVKNSSQVNY